MKIVCQTITFGESQRQHLPDLLKQVSEAGFTGVEIGFRHIQDTPPQTLNEMLKANGLELVATHLGGNLEDTQQADGERSIIGAVLDYLSNTGTTIINYSGLNSPDMVKTKAEIEMLNRSAQLCEQNHCRLLYHNHNWEFKNDWQIMNLVLENKCSALGFCPDVGWLEKAGVNSCEFLETIKGDLGAIHFKDFASHNEGIDTVELGKGVVPLKDIYNWLKTNGFNDIAVISEQDKSEIPADQAVKENAAFLQSLML